MCIAAGAVLGYLFFGGLLWSTRQAGKASGSSALIVASFAGRLMLCLVILFFILRLGGITALLTSLGSFTITQLAFVAHFSRVKNWND